MTQEPLRRRIGRIESPFLEEFDRIASLRACRRVFEAYHLRRFGPLTVEIHKQLDAIEDAEKFVDIVVDFTNCQSPDDVSRLLDR